MKKLSKKQRHEVYKKASKERAFFICDKISDALRLKERIEPFQFEELWLFRPDNFNPDFGYFYNSELTDIQKREARNIILQLCIEMTK